MRRKGSPDRGGRRLGRRGVLLAGAAALGVGGVEAGAYTRARLDRSDALDVADDAGGLVGLDAPEDVVRRRREPLVTVTNRLSPDPIVVTVALADPAAGTLYTTTDSGEAVTLTLANGASATVETETSLRDGATLAWTLTGEARATTLTATRETAVTATAPRPAVEVSKLEKLAADPTTDEFVVGQAQAQDRDGDDDLASAEYVVTDADGVVVGSRTDPAGGGQYQVQNLVVPLDTNVVRGADYTVRLTVTDADGNAATEVRTVTA